MPAGLSLGRERGYSYRWGLDEYQRVTNRGLVVQKSNLSKQGNKKIPATDPCSSPADIRQDPISDCSQLFRRLFMFGCAQSIPVF